MPVLGNNWMTIDGHSTIENGGLLIENGGPFEPLTEREFKAALLAIEAVRNGWTAAIDEHGEVFVLGTRSAADSEEAEEAEELATLEAK